MPILTIPEVRRIMAPSNVRQRKLIVRLAAFALKHQKNRELADIIAAWGYEIDLNTAVLPNLFRRKAVRRATPISSHMTAALKREIIQFALACPDMPYRKIGELFNVSDGRVSEALAGKRGEP